jgi:FKBP12-rapamycin complex-associated protein
LYFIYQPRYSLSVASKSHAAARSSSATNIMDKMRKQAATLVEQAKTVSSELIRVSILWHEQWHEGLEEASRTYFADHNTEAMLATLKPLHEMLERGPQTNREIAFQQAYGRDLQDAYDWCKKWERSKKSTDLNQAWDLYYKVFRRINKQLPQMSVLELSQVSPYLLGATDLELAVPGTYRAGASIVKIKAFNPTLTVISSKQRPRKLIIHGSDGADYMFLLKGNYLFFYSLIPSYRS